MNKIYNKKAMPLNTYAMVFENKGKNCLCIEAGFSLEEAMKKAKKSIKNKQTSFDIAEATLFLWRKVQVNELLSEYQAFEEDKPRKKTNSEFSVSEMMQEIIDNNDWTLFEKNKNKLTKAEQLYVEGRLKSKK